MRRILPPYYAALIIFIFVNHPTIKSDIYLHLLLLHNFNGQSFFGNINQSFWSIAVECQIYVLFPLFVLAWQKWGVARSAAVIFPLIYLANEAAQHTHLWGMCLDFIGLFLIGALGANFAFGVQAQTARFRNRAPWLIMAGLFVISLIVVTLTVNLPLRHPSDNGLWVLGWQVSARNALMGLSVSCLLVSATLRDNAARKFLSWKPLVWLGSFSYSLYLLHQPFVNHLAGLLFMRRVSMSASLLIFLVSVPIIIGVSYVFHLCFERPFMSSPAPKTERQAEQAAIDSPAP